MVALDVEPIIPATDHDDQGERVIEVDAAIGACHVLFTSRHPVEVAGILIDNLHLYRSGGTIDEVRAIDVDRFPYLRIADAGPIVPTEFSALLDAALNGRLLPGEGSLPIEELLATMPHVPPSFEVRSRALRNGDAGICIDVTHSR